MEIQVNHYPMVEMTGDVVKGLGELSDSSGASAKMMNNIKERNMKMFSGLANVGGVVGTVGLAYAGFPAAKTEQFAEAQGNMIDSGAISMDTAQRFRNKRIKLQCWCKLWGYD